MIASELVGDEKIGKIGRPNKMWHYTPEKENLQIRIKRLTDDNSDGEESTVDESTKFIQWDKKSVYLNYFEGISWDYRETAKIHGWLQRNTEKYEDRLLFESILVLRKVEEI